MSQRCMSSRKKLALTQRPEGFNLEEIEKMADHNMLCPPFVPCFRISRHILKQNDVYSSGVYYAKLDLRSFKHCLPKYLVIKFLKILEISFGYRKFYSDPSLKCPKSLQLKNIHRSFTPVGPKMSNPNPKGKNHER